MNLKDIQRREAKRMLVVVPKHKKGKKKHNRGHTRYGRIKSGFGSSGKYKD